MLVAFAGVGYVAHTAINKPETMAQWRGNVRNAAGGVFARLPGTGMFSSGNGYRRDYGGTGDAEETVDEEKGASGAGENSEKKDSGSETSSGSSSPAAGQL